MGIWQERSDWLVFGWKVGRSGATGLYLCVWLAGAERLACICVCSWQERSNWLVFVCVVGRSGATGLYLGGQLAGAERRDVFSLFNSYFQDPLTVTNAGRMPKKQFLILIFCTTK